MKFARTTDSIREWNWRLHRYLFLFVSCVFSASSLFELSVFSFSVIAFFTFYLFACFGLGLGSALHTSTVGFRAVVTHHNHRGSFAFFFVRFIFNRYKGKWEKKHEEIAIWIFATIAASHSWYYEKALLVACIRCGYIEARISNDQQSLCNIACCFMIVLYRIRNFSGDN